MSQRTIISNKMETNNDSINDKSSSSKQTNDSSDSENLCVLCFKNTEIYSVGECDHPVCYECSTRMRVICGQSVCPMCRQNLSKVIFTNEIQPYRDLVSSNRSDYYHKKYKICFVNLEIQKAFYTLLDHPCPICNSRSFSKFEDLEDHVRREHELFYCNLCTEHLNSFTFERKCYNRQELALHKRKGDPDDTSHRGHPLCQYCDRRYLDKEELYRHLRHDHFYCTFCDSDRSNRFYGNYQQLYEHYCSEHFVCLEGECGINCPQIFGTEIDLKAHIASVHGKLLGKQQAKQARTLQLEITLGPRGRPGTSQKDYHPPILNLRPQGNDDYSDSGSSRNETPRSVGYTRNPSITLDTNDDLEFPSLVRPSNNSSAIGVTQVQPNMSIRARAFGPAGHIREDDFPALENITGIRENGISETKLNSNQNTKINNHVPVSAILKNNNAQKTKKNSGGSSMVIHVSNRPNTNNSNSNNSITATSTAKTTKFPSSKYDFPALPGTSVNNNIPDMNSISVSTKTKSLMNDYISYVHPSSSSKITLVKKDNINIPSILASSSQSSPKRKDTKDQNVLPPTVPSLTANDFPELRALSAPATPSWVNNSNMQKKQNQESRKSKIAPPPILTISTTKQSEKKQNQNTLVNGKFNDGNKIDKKDKKQNKNDKKSGNDIKKANDIAGGKSNKDITKLEKNNNEKKVKNRNLKKDKLSDNNDTMTNVSTTTTTTTTTIDDKHKQQQQQQNQKKSSSKTKTNSNLNSTTISSPPPGFDKINNNSNNNDNDSTAPPPPGFKSVTLNSVAKSPNDLTFTTSMGEIFSIVPNHKYIPPPNSEKRNRELVTHFLNTLPYAEAFEQFKYISQKFREGQYKTLPYYEHCRAALKNKFDELFPELLVLLPDINKQQELYLEHTQHLNDSENIISKKSTTKLDVCSICKQILKLSDKVHHYKMHSENHNFPASEICNGTSKHSKNKKN